MSLRMRRSQSAKVIRENLERRKFQRERLDAEDEADKLALDQLECEPRELTKCEIILETSTTQKWGVETGYCRECQTTISGLRIKEFWKFCPVCGSVATFKYESDQDAEQRIIRQAVAASL